jgi:hypothetical protein
MRPKQMSKARMNGTKKGKGGAQLTPPARRVWWASLKERTTLDVAFDSIEKVAMLAGHLGYHKMSLPYMRTDAARNSFAKLFMEKSSNPNDVLIMMDNDHRFPTDVLPKLVESITDERGGRGVVGALAFKRGEPFEPCFFVRGEDGILHAIAQWEDGLFEGQVVGHACVAIARWVFDRLIASGNPFPFWRYEYTDGEWTSPSEDMYFAKICEASGIGHWVDTRLECPHLILSEIDRTVWGSYLANNPHIIAPEDRPEPVPGTMHEEVPVLLGSPQAQWRGEA